MLDFRRSIPGILVLAVWLFASGAYGQSDADIERYSREGQQALAEARYADAERAFEKLRDLEPDVPEIYANLGLVYFQEKKFEQAVPALRHALKLKPALPKLDTLLAMSLSELGQYKEALPSLEKGFHRSTDIAIKRMCGLQLERAYTGLHQDSKAVEVALELDRLYPSDPEILYNNGKIFGNFAFLSIQKLATVAPNSVWRHQAAAEAHESQAAYVKAIDEYQRVLALDPRRTGIHYRLGRTLLARSLDTASPADRKEASQEFQKELDLDSNNANAAYELGDIYRTSGQLDEARAAFELALKSHPDFEEAHLGLASVLMSLNQSALALPHVQQAISLNRDNPVAWYRLARVERTLGHTAESQKAEAEFKRLHDKPSEQVALDKTLAPSEVTRQEIDPQ
ncbi:MAG TPA: tetratricopeptide repeat protein [Terriglobales bacterium]|jgi:tetratricopeptide (TPR) repeat protein|nr:tetratricopeptide repeat protein [Terriglobales bacterium]